MFSPDGTLISASAAPHCGIDRKGILKLASTLEQLQQSLEQHSTSNETPLPEDVIVAAAAVPDEEPADVDAHSDRNNLDSDSDGATG